MEIQYIADFLTDCSKSLDQRNSHFLFQILLDSTLEFLDLLQNFQIQFIFLSRWTIRHSQLENVLHETRINIMESFENFNTQTIIVGNIHGVFPDFLNNTSYELLQSLCKNEALVFANFQLYLKTYLMIYAKQKNSN